MLAPKPNLLPENATGPSVAARVGSLDWKAIATDLDAYGRATTGPLLSPDECAALTQTFPEDAPYRSRIVMARHGFGRGEYKYFAYPLPPVVAALREELFPPLARLANRWNEMLGVAAAYPPDHARYLRQCHAAGQSKPTPLLLQYGTGDYNCLHQDIYGEHVFPLQVAFLLSRPDADFSGGEFVLVEQRRECSRGPRLCRSPRARESSSRYIIVRCRAAAASIGSICGTVSAGCGQAAAIRWASSSMTLRKRGYRTTRSATAMFCKEIPVDSK